MDPPKQHRTFVSFPVVNKYMHYGEVTQGVDERAEVALLSRNIVIEGRVENECPEVNDNCDLYNQDTFGGHITVSGLT